MKIIFFVINYKADIYLDKFINSINLSKNGINVKVDIHVIDNSQKDHVEFEIFKNEYLKSGVSIHSNGENVGYFGAIPIAQKVLQGVETDCVIYCNPDLQVDVNFFAELIKSKDINGIIAPAIISEGEGIDQNPKYIERIPISKMKRLEYIYSNIVSHSLFFSLAKLKEIIQNIIGKQSVQLKNETIYASHGAMFVFNNVCFFKKLKPYPCFLFGEEIFIAEEAKKSDTLIFYKPKIKVYDVRHASISLLTNKIKRDLYYKSINFLLKEYY